jgi:hypothetical protein
MMVYYEPLFIPVPLPPTRKEQEMLSDANNNYYRFTEEINRVIIMQFEQIYNRVFGIPYTAEPIPIPAHFTKKFVEFIVWTVKVTQDPETWWIDSLKICKNEGLLEFILEAIIYFRHYDEYRTTMSYHQVMDLLERTFMEQSIIIHEINEPDLLAEKILIDHEYFHPEDVQETTQFSEVVEATTETPPHLRVYTPVYNPRVRSNSV